MPYIKTSTTVKVTKEMEKALTEEYGKAIELIPGKGEEWLMLNLFDECRMAFRGSNDNDICMIEVDIFGSAAPAHYDALTKKLCEIAGKILGVKGDKVYVKYRECDRWGYDGINF